MIGTVEAAQADLAAIVGASHVATEEAACAAFTVDGQAPRAVVYPRSGEQVAEVLRCASEHELAVIPCRNATKLEIGNAPRRYDIALSLKDLNQVWHYEPADLTVSVEPGMKFGDFQHFVGRDRLWLPLDPAGGARASVGGIVATNAAGPLRVFYGAPRDMVLGMKVATAAGKVIKTGGRVVKNVAGYDLGKLLIGSYGSLGVIVEVNFKLFPRPAERATFVLGFDHLGSARDLRRRIMNSPLTPMRLVLLNAVAAEELGGVAGAGKGELELFAEVGGSERVVARYERELTELARAAGAPMRRLEASEAGQSWDLLADLRPWLLKDRPEAVLMKASLPLGASEEFASRAEQEAAGARLACFAHVGVGTVYLALRERIETVELKRLIERLRAAAGDLGGALVVERCLPALKRSIDAWGAPGDDLEVMRKLKAAWDPKGILSPGRALGGI